jgi:predicted acylesterase/phospholipase RssA
MAPRRTRALVLSGGGAKGAYEAGAIGYLLGTLERDYDYYCGVSVGSINCLWLAHHAIGAEKTASETLQHLWFALLGDVSIYEASLWRKMQSLWKYPSFYDTPGDLDVMRASGKRLRVGAVSFNTHAYQLFTEQDDDIVQGVLASSAQPMALRPPRFRDQLWTDGGVRSITPLKSAIDAGVNEIDVIKLQRGVKGEFREPKNVIQLALDVVDIMSNEIGENDLKLAGMYNRMVEGGIERGKRFVPIRVLRPSASLGESLDFAPDVLRERYALGFEDAKAFDWESS